MFISYYFIVYIVFAFLFLKFSDLTIEGHSALLIHLFISKFRGGGVLAVSYN